MKSESDFVKFLEKIKTFDKNIIKGIGDDCAVLKFHPKQKYVITTDTSLLGPHFTKDYTPEEIGHKSLATNISDIAAMGCSPKYALFALTLPKMSATWINRFFKGVTKLLKKHEISIIGGDTTKGPMSVSITLIGEQKYKILRRDKAKIHDDIYVTGNIGSARAALLLKRSSKGHNYFRKHLVNPTPRVNIGLEISKFASSCIDISDGLAKDLKNIAISSRKGFIVDIDKIPIKPKFNFYVSEKLREICILGGGEDYELCFTCDRKYSSIINDLSNKYKIKITKIGTICKSGFTYRIHGKKYIPKVSGYDHFQN